MAHTHEASHEKATVALISIAAAIGLVSFKIIVAWLTGSLGILAEAVHSGLDLVASLITLFAIRLADRPADRTHHYGHAKVENISALIEAILLLLTALWVMYEAIRRLLFHEGTVQITIWAFLVMFLSIGVDLVRSRALLRVARKVGSQALEADALNFRADLWSSSMVIVGLSVVWLAERFSLPSWLTQADAIAALAVSLFVLWSSLRLAKATFDALTDRAPDQLGDQIETALRQIEAVIDVRSVRLRRTGNKVFTDMVVEAPRTLTFEKTHALTERIERVVNECVLAEIPQGEVDSVVHIEPMASPTETFAERIHYLAEQQGIHAHDIHIREVSGRLEADFDVEVPSGMTLSEAHTLATRLELTIREENPSLERVTTHLEAPNEIPLPRQEVTQHSASLTNTIRQLVDETIGFERTHDIHLYRKRIDTAPPESDGEGMPELDLVLHATFDADAPIEQVHIRAEEAKQTLRRMYPFLGTITIHTEPPESDRSEQN